MAAYRRVYDSRYLQDDCQEPGSAQEPYARQSSMGYLFYIQGKGGSEGEGQRKGRGKGVKERGQDPKHFGLEPALVGLGRGR